MTHARLQQPRINERAVRVVHVVRRFEPLLGGTERYVGDLARAQAQAGMDVTVVTLDRDVLGVVAGRLPRHEVDRGVRIVRLAGTGSGRFGLTYRPDSLLRIVRRSDVTHVHDLRFMLGIVATFNRLARRPTILHTHGLIYGTRAFWRLKRVLSRAYYEPLIRATRARVVCSSPADRARLTAYMPSLARQAATIMNGVDLGAYWNVVRSPVPGQIVVVGRVAPLKGIDRVLRALPGVALPWHLLIHGAAEDEEDQRLMRMARDLGIADRVTLTGDFTPAAEPRLLTTPALAVFPSTSEALGMALIDAMAAGVPIVASDIPAHRNVLESVAPTTLVDFDRPEAVAAAIRHRLTAPEADTQTLTDRLQDRARYFDIGRLVGEINDLYRDLGVLRSRRKAR